MKNKFVLALLLLFSHTVTHAIVDMNSASYSNVWTDMEVPGTGYDLKIVRAYRSRTLFNGMFGFGWCSMFETKLETTSEGNVKISECGDGQDTVYSPREIQKKDIENTFAQIIAKMKADPKQKILSADFFKKLQNDLFDDGTRRSNLARDYGVSIPIKEGTKFLANGQEVENVVFSKGAYVRTLWVSGGKAKYHKHLSDWSRLSTGDAKRLDGVTGASVGAGRTLKVSADLADALIDAGYEIRIDAAAENMRDSPSEVRVPLSKVNVGKPQAGQQYIQSVTFQLQ